MIWRRSATGCLEGVSGNLSYRKATLTPSIWLAEYLAKDVSIRLAEANDPSQRTSLVRAPIRI
jgi:hypothetical protein